MGHDFLGFGVGLRAKHYPYILKNWPQIDWFEVISENYMIPGGRPLSILDQIAQRYPLVMHGVSLSLGSAEPLDFDYLTQLKKLAQRIKPKWISDHVCWTGVNKHNSHDLLPLPYHEESLKTMVDKIKQVQDFFEQQILIENPSSYMEFTTSTMTEWEFINNVANQSDCKLLLDINNIYVSSYNHHFDPLEYIQAISQERVAQFHLAGHSYKKKFLLDTHDHPIKKTVFKLYQEALKRFGKISTLVEWDDHIPSFPRLLNEVEKVKQAFYETSTQAQIHPTPSFKAHLSP